MCIIASYFCHLIKLFCLFPRFWSELCVAIWRSALLQIQHFFKLYIWNHANFQKSSEEVLCFKTWQMYLSRFKNWSSTAISIENYENQFFRTIFHAYPSYVFSFSFLTILDIYKDYFKSHYKIVALVVASIL